MKLKEIKEILNAQVLYGEDDLDFEVDSAFSSDLMSDVLAFVTENTVLITGLNNIHVFRTAQMCDIHCIVFSKNSK